MESKFHIYIGCFLFLRSNYESESDLQMKIWEKYYIKYILHINISIQRYR